MNIRHTLTLAASLGLGLSQTAFAQQEKFDVRDVTGETARHFQQRLARGQQTRALKAFQPNGANSVMVLHCFDVVTRDKKSLTRATLNRRLVQGKRAVWQQIAQLNLTGYDSNAIDGLYIDQKRKSVPALRIFSYSNNEFLGSTTEVMLIERIDLSANTITKDFSRADSTSHDEETLDFSGVDDDGFVIVKHSSVPRSTIDVASPEEHEAQTQRKNYRWTGRKFELAKQPH